MAMVRKDGKLPANARVDVDYTGKKPKISFSYPKLPARGKDKKNGKKWSTTKKDAVDQNAGGLHTLLLLAIFILIGSVIYINYYDPGINPTDCEVVLDEYHFRIENNLTDFMANETTYTTKDYDNVYGADFYCNDNTTHYRVAFDPQDTSFGISRPGFYWRSTGSTWELIWPMLRFMIVFFLIMVLFVKVNRIITRWIVKKPWYQKWLPEHNAKKRMKKYWKFTAKDFDSDTSPFVEVPNFKNISIEYKTKGDFSKQLKKIKIREHRWHHYDTKKEKVGKLKVEILKWTARFYFDKIPKDGYMEVVYY